MPNDCECSLSASESNTKLSIQVERICGCGLVEKRTTQQDFSFLSSSCGLEKVKAAGSQKVENNDTSWWFKVICHLLLYLLFYVM